VQAVFERPGEPRDDDVWQPASLQKSEQRLVEKTLSPRAPYAPASPPAKAPELPAKKRSPRDPRPCSQREARRVK
jgi:hypothetical protein